MNGKESPKTLLALQQSAGDYLNTKEVAEFLGVQPNTVSKWLREGRLPAVKLSNKAGWRVRVMDLVLWIEQVASEASDDEGATWLP